MKRYPRDTPFARETIRLSRSVGGVCRRNASAQILAHSFVARIDVIAPNPSTEQHFVGVDDVVVQLIAGSAFRVAVFKSLGVYNDGAVHIIDFGVSSARLSKM